MTLWSLVQPWFVPNVRGTENPIRAIAPNYTKGIEAAGGELDFANGVTLDIPLPTVMSVFDMLETDEPIMARLAQNYCDDDDKALVRDSTLTHRADFSCSRVYTRHVGFS